MIRPLMVFSKNVKVSQKRCLGTSIESFTGSSLSEQIMVDSGARYGRMIDSFSKECLGKTFITTLKLTKAGFRNTLIFNIAYSNLLHQYVLFLNALNPFPILIYLFLSSEANQSLPYEDPLNSDPIRRIVDCLYCAQSRFAPTTTVNGFESD